MTHTVLCDGCDREYDIEAEIETSQMREEVWGKPTTWTEVEVTLPDDTACPDCGTKPDDGDLGDEIAEAAV